MKPTEKELSWCQQTTKEDFSSHPMFELHALINFMKQELIRLADLNDEYEAYVKHLNEKENGNNI